MVTLRRFRLPSLMFVAGLVLGFAGYARIGPSAAAIDSGVQAALLLVISVTLAATAGAAGAVLGASIAADAARDTAKAAQVEAQKDRDDAKAARDADREDARRSRFADRKVALAVDLLRAADLHRRQADQQVVIKWERWQVYLEVGEEVWIGEIPAVGSTEPIRAALLALTLVAPAATNAAGRLYEATVPLGNLAGRWREPDGQDDGKAWAKLWNETIAEWDDARHEHVDAVRADLAI